MKCFITLLGYTEDLAFSDEDDEIISLKTWRLKLPQIIQ